MQHQHKHVGGKTPSVVVVVVLLACAAVAIAWIFRPEHPSKPQCIVVPEAKDDSTQRSAIELGLKLEEIPVDAHLKSNFARLSTTTYQQLSDKQVAFLLLLRAIGCYLESADTPEKQALVRDLSHELALTARAMWGAEYGLKGGGLELSFKERDILKESPFGPAIFNELRKYDIR